MSDSLATPQFALEVHAGPKLSLTLPYEVEFTLRRIDDREQQGDGQGRPCIVRWSPGVDGFSAAGLELWRHTSSENGDSLVRVDTDHKGSVVQASPCLVVYSWDRFLREFQPGEKVHFTAPLPDRYYRKLVEGEHYDLVWPGGEVAIWNWGTIREHEDQELRANDPSRPVLCVPAGSRTSFTAVSEAVPWPDRAVYEARHGFLLANTEERQWRAQQLWEQENGAKRLEAISERERVPSTPFLSVTLECPSTMSHGHPFGVILKVAYEGIVSSTREPEPTERCITFHTHDFRFPSGLREGFRLWRRRRHEASTGLQDDGKWEECNLPEDDACLIVDDPPVAVRVGNDTDNFASLRVGEIWTVTEALEGQYWSSLPRDAVPGDEFSFAFQGTTVDWWDWGDQEHEHQGTVVKLPCWIAGPIVDPTNNGGRPRLVVPGSTRRVGFKLVG